MDAANIPRSLYSDPDARSVLTQAYSAGFKYSPSKSEAQQFAALQAEADALLAPEIKSETWSVGDCGCVVQRIYHRDHPEDAQTIHACACECHPGLTVEELHDAHEHETLIRASTHRLLHDCFPGDFCCATDDGHGLRDDPAAELCFEWEGTGKERCLVVHSHKLADEHEAALAEHADILAQAHAEGVGDATRFRAWAEAERFKRAEAIDKPAAAAPGLRRVKTARANAKPAE